VWSGTEFIANVSLDRQVRLQNVSGVGCDTAEELIICGAEQLSYLTLNNTVTLKSGLEVT